MQALLKLALKAGKIPERMEGGGWELRVAASPAQHLCVYTHACSHWPCMDANGLPEQRPDPEVVTTFCGGTVTVVYIKI